MSKNNVVSFIKSRRGEDRFKQDNKQMQQPNEKVHLTASDWFSLILFGLKALLYVPVGGVLMWLETLLPNENHHRVRSFLWEDVMIHRWSLMRFGCIYLPDTYGGCVYYFATEQAQSAPFCLTFDDAPGDDPEMFRLLLDILAAFGARATFFCTTSKITPDMAPLLERLVAEGHQLGNHMPEDIRYDNMSEADFTTELCKSEDVLAAYSPEFGSRSAVVEEPRTRLFRPPKGRLSPVMAKVLSARGYWPSILGDVFSNDPHIGGTLVPPSTTTIDYHVGYVLRNIRPGSIVIFHCARANGERAQITDITSALLQVLLHDGRWRAVTIGHILCLEQ